MARTAQVARLPAAARRMRTGANASGMSPGPGRIGRAMAVVALCAPMLAAADCLNEGAGRFRPQPDGTATDTATGLTWMRCSVGQRWDGEVCTDAALSRAMMDWHQAVEEGENAAFAEHADWRLPSIDELETLAGSGCPATALPRDVFPNAPAARFWSSTEFSDNPDYAWRIDLADGEDNADLKTTGTYRAWLVRGPRYTAAAAAPPPPARPRSSSSLLTDGIHDPAAPAVRLLQPPEEATQGFPAGGLGEVDWVDALGRGLVDPRSQLEGGGEMAVLNLDIIMTRTKTMPYVRFPHDAHTRWLTCSNCHPRIFKPRAGGNPITMDGILLGVWCGVCHGRVAFPLMDCARCHNVPRGPSETD